MSSEAYISLLDKQLAAFSQALSELRETPDSEKIHAARLLRKRISTLLRWVGEISDSLDVRKNIHRSRDIFSALGDVRDLQMASKLMLKYSPEPSPRVQAFMEELIGEEREAVSELQGEIESFTEETSGKISQSVRKALKKSGETDFDIAADKYLHKLFRNLARVAKNADHEKALHKLRARIKEVPYFLEIMEAASHPCTLTDEQVQAAKEMGDHLGNWHDLVLLSDAVRKWVKKQGKKMDETEAGNFASLKAQLKTDLTAALALIAPVQEKPLESATADTKEEVKEKKQKRQAVEEDQKPVAEKKVKEKKKGSGKKKAEDLPAEVTL